MEDRQERIQFYTNLIFEKDTPSLIRVTAYSEIAFGVLEHCQREDVSVDDIRAYIQEKMAIADDTAERTTDDISLIRLMYG